MIATRTETESPDGGRVFDVLVVVALAACLTLYVSTVAVVEDLGSDTSTYFELARSIRHEHRYWFNFEPHTIYPPGYPLLLAGLMALAGETFSSLIRFAAPIYFIGLYALYRLVKLQRGARTAFVVVVLAALSKFAFHLATAGFLSEVPYFTVSVLALLFIELANRTASPAKRAGLLALVAVCASWLLMLRGIGVTFVAALILWIALPRAILAQQELAFSLQRVRRWLPVILLPLATQFAWSTWTARHTPKDRPTDFMQSYGRQILKSDPHQIDSPNLTITQVPARMLRMLGTRTTNALGLVLNRDSVSLSAFHPVCLAFLAIVGLGFATALLREGRVLDYYVLAYGGVLLLYPFDEGQRYLYPLQPFIVLYGIDGLAVLRNVSRRIGARLGGTAAAMLGSDALFLATRSVLLGAVVVTGAYGVYVRAEQNLHQDPARFSQAKTVLLSQWVLQNTRESDVIMDDQFAILHRLTRRRTIRFPLSIDAGLIAERIRSEGVTFVVVANERKLEYFRPGSQRRFEGVKRLHPRLFVPVHVFEGGTVYRVEREGETAGATAGPPQKSVISK